MNFIKEIIKAPIENNLYGRYLYQLEMSYVSYDSFVKEQENYDFSKLEATNKVSVYTYDSLEKDFDFSKIESEYVIFCTDTKGLDDRAMDAVADAFDNNSNFMVVYADEDEYNHAENIRLNPWYKPNFSPDTLLDYMYYGNMVAFKKDALSGYSDISNIYELALKVSMKAGRKGVGHINNALYHSHYLKKMFCGKEYSSIKADYLNTETENKSVSVIIPSKDNPEILEKCLYSMTGLTRDVSYEIIVIDNGSSEINKAKVETIIEDITRKMKDGVYALRGIDDVEIQYVYAPQPFNFSRMCNQGAKKAKGDFVLFLNDDIEIREGKWLSKMLSVAAREHVGAVGAKLYYPNSMVIQHAGITNLRLGPVHKLQFKEDRASYYFGANEGVRNVLAVTGACLLVNKQKFDEVGGFAEELEVAFNDVDLCFRLYEYGYYNAVCNNTHLWHHESLSRGADEAKEKLERLTDERRLLYERHCNLYGRDPFYSKFLSNDILDTNYSKIYEYDYAFNTEYKEAEIWSKKVKEAWYNECLITSMEFVGTVDEFEGNSTRIFDLKELGIDKDKKKLGLISGYAFVAGSDNSLFTRSVILKGSEETYKLDVFPVYRPDLEMNLDMDENALMCGFSVVFDLTAMKEGTYQVAVLSKSNSSRLRLYKETNKYIRV